PVLDADVRLDDAEERIEDQRIGDDEVERFGIRGGGRLPHAVADHFSAAELDLVSVTTGGRDEVTFDLHEEVRIREPDTIAYGGAKHLRILATGQVKGHVRVSR